eukprot:Em0005g994a
MEGIKTYAASLQKLTEHCDFGDTLSDALRDRLVCGMQNGAVQKRLLGKADLTFAKALEVAELEEMVTRDEAQLHEGQPKEMRGEIKMPISMPIKMSLGHLLNHAIAAEEIICQTNASSGGESCRFCKLQGHAERVCRKKMKAESTRKTSGNKELKGDSGSDIEDNIDFMEWKSHPPVHGRRTNQCVEGDIPSKWNWAWGQQCPSSPPYTMYKEEMAHIQLRKSTVYLKTYTGQRVNPPW